MNDAALADLARDGWTSFAGTLEDVIKSAALLGWQPVSLRRGDPLVSELRPVPASAARPNSLSSRTGTGPQPLHTDGAHLLQPPDVVALSSIDAHPASTRVFALHPADRRSEDLRHGVFRVSDGRRSFYSFAMQDERLRFDPFCMSACDGYSRRVVEFFRAAFTASGRHDWSRESPQVLLIDNRRTLHAREAVTREAPPRLLRRIAFRQPETT